MAEPLNRQTKPSEAGASPLVKPKSSADSPPAETARAADSVPAEVGPFAELPVKFGRYEIRKELGRGQMGAVYLAKDGQLDRLVALKVARVSASGSAKILKRMEVEAKAAAKIDHPLICKVYDAGEIDGIRFIALQYIEGEDLKQYLKRVGRKRPVDEAVRLILQILRALEAAHAQGVIHRDLKPDNVMLNKNREPVIMDFGLARQTIASSNAGLTQGMIVGTAAYMSPEQATGRAEGIDHRCDIYAAGTMLFELLTGEWPFTGGAIEVMGKKCVQEPPTPLSLDPTLDPQLGDVCQQMIAKQKVDRYRTCAEVIECLEAIELNSATAKQSAPVPPRTEFNAGEMRPERTNLVKELSTPSDARETPKRRSDNRAETFLKNSQDGTANDHRADASVKMDDEKMRLEASAAVDLAQAWIKKHEYSDAVRILSQVPMKYRTPQLRSVLQQAEERLEEVTELKALEKEIPKALAGQRFPELKAAVRRYLELNPENKKMKELWGTLVHYKSEKRFFIDYEAGRIGKSEEIELMVSGYRLTIAAIVIGTILSIPLGLYFWRYLQTMPDTALELQINPDAAGKPQAMPTVAMEVAQATAVVNAIPEPSPKVSEAAFRDWMNTLAALPAAQQAEQVTKKLRELNPEFDGKATASGDSSIVTEMTFLTDHVQDISPVRALPGLKRLNISGSGAGRGQLSDLSPLKGMPLNFLCCAFSRVSDLTALSGMPLESLWCDNTQVADLSPLKGAPLKGLLLFKTEVVDLSPLSGMPLEYLDIDATKLTSLEPLKGMNIKVLRCNASEVHDISPLKGMPLVELHIDGSKISDISALQGMELSNISLAPGSITKGIDSLRQMSSLKTIRINGKEMTPAEFWKKYDAREFGKPLTSEK